MRRGRDSAATVTARTTHATTRGANDSPIEPIVAWAYFCQLLHQKAEVLTFTFGVDGGDGPYTDMENPDTGFPTPPRMS